MANYQIQAPVLFENFETVGDWTPGGTAGYSFSVDSTIFQEGTGSIKLQAASDPSSNFNVTKTISADFSRAGVISFDVYIPDLSTVSGVTVYLASQSNFSKFFSKGFNALTLGWNRIRIPKTLWGNSGGEDWANTMIRLRVRVDSTASGGGIAYFDNLTYGSYHRPKVIVTCDDGFDSQYLELFAYAKSRGVKGTLYLNGANIDQSPKMSTAQITEMYNAGWDLSNHNYNHTVLTTLSTQAEMENQEIGLMKQWLIDRGFTRNNCHLHHCFPGGGYNATALLALQNQGYLTSRTIIAQAGVSVPTPPLRSSGSLPYLFVTRNLGIGVTLDSVKADIDYAVASGATLLIESHKFITTPTASTEWEIVNMQGMVDYIQKLVLGNVIDNPTVSEWYNGLTQPRKVL